MKFDWKYGLITNIPLFVLFFIVCLRQLFSQFFDNLQNYLIIVAVFVISWVLYYYIRERSFYREHPEYKASNRKISNLGWIITTLGVLLLLGLIGISNTNNFTLYWAILTLIIFFRDSLSRVNQNLDKC